MPDDHAEILRLRERVHRLETELPLLSLRLDAQASRCDKVEAEVDAMIEHDKVAEAFAAGMKAARSELFSRPAKIIGVLVGLSSVTAVSIQVGRVAGWIG